jgi:prepilin-type N-terminal cleavage/methylation domain-containing protein/prepilin-type processing-associated H-X9-DG protein
MNTPPVNRRPRCDAFTLIELLVVIAIIAVLAALLFPTLSRAKMASWNAACKNNLRQSAVCLQLYSDEANAYPYALDWGTQRFWYDQMKSYYSANKGILWCPAFKGYRDVDAAVGWFGTSFFYYRSVPSGNGPPGVSYGYNGYGLRSTGTVYSDSSEILGVGCSLPAGLKINPVGLARIKVPSDMICMADSMYAPVETATTFSYLLAVGDGSRPSPDRHGGGSNVAFGDGHSENILNKKLIADTDESRRRWNNDHEPHPEIVLP